MAGLWGALLVKLYACELTATFGLLTCLDKMQWLHSQCAVALVNDTVTIIRAAFSCLQVGLATLQCEQNTNTAPCIHWSVTCAI